MLTWLTRFLPRRSGYVTAAPLDGASRAASLPRRRIPRGIDPEKLRTIQLGSRFFVVLPVAEGAELEATAHHGTADALACVPDYLEPERSVQVPLSYLGGVSPGNLHAIRLGRLTLVARIYCRLVNLQ